MTPDTFQQNLGTEQVFGLLSQHVHDLPKASAIALIGAGGTMVNLSRQFPSPALDMRDRDFYRYLSTHNDPRPFLGEVQRGRVSDQQMLFLARRITRPTARFSGSWSARSAFSS